MATLLVVRHGEAEGNRDHRFIGQSQTRLTDHGRQQAEALAERLRKQPVTRIISSDLVRCVETVTPLGEATGIEIETNSHLREVDNGEWTGLLPEQISSRWPAMWADYAAGADVHRPGGETWSDVTSRVVPVAQDLLTGDGVVVVATHSGPSLILAMWAAGLRQEGNIFRTSFGAPHNTAMTVIGPGPRLITYNDAGHATALPDQRLPFAPVKSP